MMKRVLSSCLGLLTALPVLVAEIPYPDQPFAQAQVRHFHYPEGVRARAPRSFQVDVFGHPRIIGRTSVVTLTEQGWQRAGGHPVQENEPDSPENRDVSHFSDSQQRSRIAAGVDGLYEKTLGGAWVKLLADDGLGRVWGTRDVRAVTYDANDRLWFGVLAGVARRELDGSWDFFAGQDGLPFNQFTCAAAAPDGSVWFGTTKGAIHWQDGQWRYRQGRRWLLNDHVVAIQVRPNGTVWIATEEGLTRLEYPAISLAKKAQHYEAEVEQLIKRTPYGYTSPVTLGSPGDREQIRRHDNDNDGLWTSMYGAGQCFAYAATKDSSAKKRAEEAFEALRFLQVVTEGSSHEPPSGYVARTIRSTELPNPNIGRVERDRRQQATGDQLWKVYEPRWPLSEDGKWYWKSDTSSDELDGHYFFYPLYHDLVAETAAEKARVKEVVRKLTDHLIKNDFNLTDHDGKPTRWGVFDPSDLNHNPNWQIERGLNSLSMLAYLTVAHHVTGEERYQNVIERLKREHAYDTNAMVPKVQRGFGSGNQSDDEMAFMSFYNLFRYSQDEGLKRRLLRAFYSYWTLEQPEQNPFFNFAYAACAQGQSVSDPWGEHSVDPWDHWLDESIETLKAMPLDRVHWAHQNSHRLDILRLPRQQSIDTFSSESQTRGVRTNGKVIPPDERSFNHWNTDPFRLDYGGDGRTLGCGTVFLLPYYMGLYHGFIQSP